MELSVFPTPKKSPLRDGGGFLSASLSPAQFSSPPPSALLEMESMMEDTKIRFIRWLILAAFIGVYMFYGQSAMDALAFQYGLEPSSYLYALGAIGILAVATLTGKLITRGMFK